MRTSNQMTERGAAEDLAVTDLGAPKSSEADPGVDVVSRFGPELAQLTVVMLWASTFVVAKAAFAEVSPLAFLFARFVIMVALAFAVLLVLQRGAGRWVDRSDWGLFVLAGLTGYTLYQLGFILGLSRTSPFSSSLLIAMVPLFTVLILAVMGEPTPLQGWVGLGVALVGVALFLLDKRGASAGTLLGDVLSIGAAVSFAVYGIITRPLVAQVPGGDLHRLERPGGDRASAPRLAAGCVEAGLADSFSLGVVEHRLSRHLSRSTSRISSGTSPSPGAAWPRPAHLACWCRSWPGCYRRYFSGSRSAP